MDNAEDLLKAGELEACFAAVTERVRADASSPAPRIFLFQLFCVLGEWERARRQLYVLKDLDASTIPMFETYDAVIQCEHIRQAVFAGRRSALMFGHPEQWAADLAAAVEALANGRIDQARALREQGFSNAPAASGMINGERFDWLADGDGRLGPMLEVFLNGNYYWVPLNAIERIDLDPPEDLRDLVWMPARFRWRNEGQAVGFIPARYPGSESSDDSRIRLSRLTRWQEVAEDFVLGEGQRVLVSDREDYPLLGVTEIAMDQASSDQGNG